MNFSNEDTASRSDIFHLHRLVSFGASRICIIQSSTITFLSNRSLVCLTSSQYQEVRNYCHARSESFAAEILKVRLVINTCIFGSLNCSCITTQNSRRQNLLVYLAETSLLPAYSLWHSSQDRMNCVCSTEQSLQARPNCQCLRDILWSHLAMNILSFLEVGDFSSCEQFLLFPDSEQQGSKREYVSKSCSL